MHAISSGPEEVEDDEELIFSDYYEEDDDHVADRRFFGGGDLFHKDKPPKHYVTYGHYPYDGHYGHGLEHDDTHSGYGHSGYGHSGYGHSPGYNDHSGYSGHHSGSGYGDYDHHSGYGYEDEPVVEFGLPFLGSVGLFKGGRKRKRRRRPPPLVTKGKPPGPLLVVRKREPKKPDSFLHDIFDTVNDLVFGHPTIFFTLLGRDHPYVTS